jgi:hypothetical protein
VKFTPEPWLIDRDRDQNDMLYVYKPAEETLIRGLLVDINIGTEADARLIAEAPAMYEALRAILAAEDRFISDTEIPLADDVSEVEKARALLARIDGGA